MLSLLGDVCFRMGDLPAAGRYWFLTERSGPEVERAFAAMHERHGRGPLPLLNVLPVKPPLDAYAPLVQQRLQELIEGTGRSESSWFSKARRFTDADEAPGDRLAVLLVALFAGIWLLGLVALVYLLWRLVAFLV